MIKFTDSILDTINILLNLGVGNISRLEHVKKMILEDKPLYSSDKQYVNNLASTYIDNYQENAESKQDILINCRNCSTAIPITAKFCTLCGTKQKREHRDLEVLMMVKKYNPLRLASRPNSYQVLTIIGGLSVMMPVLFIIARMEPLLDAINYETGRDLSEMSGIFVFLGILSSTLSVMSMAVTFLVKNPKKVGRILFFTAFGIILSSVLIGMIGFFFILFASKVAYKKRGY